MTKKYKNNVVLT